MRVLAHAAANHSATGNGPADDHQATADDYQATAHHNRASDHNRAPDHNRATNNHHEADNHHHHATAQSGNVSSCGRNRHPGGRRR